MPNPPDLPPFPTPAEERAPVPPSFEAKSAALTFIALVVVLALYSLVAGRMLLVGVTESVVPYVPILLLATVLLVGILVAGHLLAALGSERIDPPDERDRAIADRAEARSSWLLGLGVLAAIFGLALPIGPAWIANGLLACLFASEILQYGLRVLAYRRDY